MSLMGRHESNVPLEVEDEPESPVLAPPTMELETLPVIIMEDRSEQGGAAALSAWTTYTLQGNEPAFQLLSANSKRRQATIWVLPGFVNNNTNGNVWVGTREQVQAASAVAPTAGILASGMNVNKQSRTALWCKPDGTNSLTVVVFDEWDMP